MPANIFDYRASVFWNTNKARFPRIFLIKLRLDCLSATSVDAERAFSVANYVYNKYTNKMSPEKLRLKMMARNLKKTVVDQ